MTSSAITDRILTIAAGIAVFSSAALILLLDAPWYRSKGSATIDGEPGPGGGAWVAFTSVDVAIAIAAAAAAIIAFVGFAERTPAGFAIALGFSLAAAGLILYRLLEIPVCPPGFDECRRIQLDLERLWGIWVSLAVGVLAVVGNGVALAELRRQQRPRR